MTKKEFDKIEQKLHCSQCDRELDKSQFSYHDISKKGKCLCKACVWENLHNGLPIVDGFSEYEVRKILHMIFNDVCYVNEMAVEMDRTIDEIVKVIKILKVGNKKVRVNVTCSCCGKIVEKKISEYCCSDTYYCSHECYYKDKSNHMQKGKDSPYYKRIITKCDNCGKEIAIIPYDFKRKNRYGDNHNFCCQECYWEFRSKYYRGDKSPVKDIKLSEEALERRRKQAVINSRSNTSDRLNTKIQKIINGILDKNNISYIREYEVGFYAIDNYLPEHNLMIEVMGDYWHASPLRYNEHGYKLNQTQRTGIIKDKSKHTYIKKYLGISILYLWEKDILENPDKCEELIMKYINNQGILTNYHSFNWEYIGSNLVQTSQITIPYQEMNTSKYNHLFIS